MWPDIIQPLDAKIEEDCPAGFRRGSPVRCPILTSGCRSEADQVLDRCFSVRRDDLAGNEIVTVLELAFGSGLDNGLGARGANLRERIEFRCRRRVEIDLV